MNVVSSIAGWAITKVAEIVMNKMIERVGLFDATCEKCNTPKTSIVIPEGKTVPIRCASCGYAADVHISSLESLTVHHAGLVNVHSDQANIAANTANIVAADVKVVSQNATIHVSGPVHFVGRPYDPSAPRQIIETQFLSEPPTRQAAEQKQLEQEVSRLQERIIQLERRLDEREGMI